VARKQLGKYEIIDRLGRGGMAEVYRGYHPALDRFVAIKLLHPFLSDDPEFKDRFENEARNVAKLKHPNIVQVYDFEYDVESESYYMVMELIDGQTLKDRLLELARTGQSFPVGEAIRIVRSAAEALDYAHRRGMIHRDVKPANLMLDDGQRVVLTDFGIAKIVTGAQFTSSGGMVGTPAYMAPEQGLGEQGDERSDLYSLGVILFQFLTGRLPFDAETPLAVVLKHVNEPIPSLRQHAPHASSELDRIVRKALAKDPDERYQTAAALAEDLASLDEQGHVYATLQGAGLHADAAPGAAPSRSIETTEWQRLRALITETGSLRPPEPPPASGGAAARLRPRTVLLLSAALIAMAALTLFGFNDGAGRVSGLLGLRDDQPDGPPLTVTASALLALSPTATDGPPAQAGPMIAANPTMTPRRAASPTRTPTRRPSATPSPTEAPTVTPSPDASATAVALLVEDYFATQAAASPTPNMTQTLAACDFEYYVVSPEDYDTPPSRTAFDEPRLVRSRENFTFELTLLNTGSCAWPPRARLTFNPQLTANPDETVDLSRVENVCATDETRPGTNFARQQRSNFFFEPAVDIEETAAITFTGVAPPLYGCYYTVWDLLYPGSDVPIGRPLVLAIRVWGS